MCFVISRNKKFNAKNLFGDKESIICYKVLRRRRNRSFVSPCAETPFLITKGPVVSDRKGPTISPTERQSTYIQHGIHTFLTECAARGFKAGTNEVIREVRCYKEDYVASNDNQAVFVKVYPIQKKKV